MSTRRMKLWRPRRLAITAIAAAVLGYLAVITPTSVVNAQSGAPLVQAHQMVYEGSFRLPDPQGAAPNGWNGGGALAMSPDGQGLFGSGEGGYIAELNIPAIQQSTTVAGFATATYRQPFTQIWNASAQGLGCGSGGELGGILPWAGSLITTRYCFYDAAYVQTRSHFRSSLQLGPTSGPFMVQSPVGTGGGSAGFVSGYMAAIPAEWQALLGGPALTGNCCISIITRTSWGPAASVFNPAQVGVVDPVPATAVVGYPTGTPLDGGADCSATSVLFNCNTAVRGLAFPSGTSSVLFFGTQGIGESCYGRGTPDPALHRTPDPNAPGEELCYDPAGGSKGNHAFPYRFQVWAYDANDLVRVKNGQLAPHQVRPYAVWPLDYPFPHISRSIGGVAYDPATQRLYVSAWAADGTDGYKPLMHVFRINAGTPPPPSDTVAPNVSLASPANGGTVSGTVTLSASATDNVGVAGVWFTVDGQTVGVEDTTAPYQFAWNSAGVPNGSHVIQSVARDAAGNTGSSSTAWVTVSNSTTADTSAPTVTLTSPANSAVLNGTATLSANALDNVGVTSVQFWINGSLAGTDTTAPYSMGWNTTVVANAQHSIYAVARDAAGNSGTSTTATVTVNNSAADATPPVVGAITPANGTTISGTATLAAAVTDNVGVVGVRFLIDGVQVGAEDLTAPYQTTWVTTSANNGTRNIEVQARDAAGNNAEASVNVTVNNLPQDTTPPTVNITAPATGSTVSGTVTLAGVATDNVGVAGVQFTVDGVSVGAEDTTAPYSISWNSASIANGSHMIRAIARDMGGTTTTSGPVTVTVNNTTSDTTAPTVNMTAPASNAVVSNTVTVSASASDNVGVTNVQFTLDGVNIGAPDTAAPYTISWATNGVPNGVHTLRAVARDAAGNTRTSSGRSVNVSNTTGDSTAPAVSISTPSAGSTLSGTVNITASASDNVQFAIDGVAVGSEDTTAPFSQPWSTPASLNKNYTVTATARDAAGNRTTSNGVTVRVRNNGRGKAGDLNDDGLVDLLFRHDTGRLHSWYMDGGEMIGNAPTIPDTVNPVWQVVSVDDFDGDRKSDLLWQNSVTGQVYLWFMDRGTLVGDAPLVDAGEWQVAATGDFNADGKADMVWQHPTTGQVRASLMDGMTTIVDAPLTTVETSWRVAGASDLNGDGRADLVWQNSATGGLAYWLMNGTAILSSGALNPTAVNVAWQIRAVEDFDQDGHADLVFQHASSGQLYIWYLNRTSLARHGYLTPSQVAQGWRVTGGK
jgi:hypothetical protein